jgi:hypothetical protein
MRLFPVAASAALLAVTACGSATVTAPRAAAAPSASATAHRSPAAPLAATTACKDILATLAGIGADAKSQATARHKQYPSVSVSDLTGAYLANDLAGNGGTRVATDQAAAGITAGLYGAEQDLITASEDLDANYGQVAADSKYGAQAEAALAAIGKSCGNG